MFSRHAQRLGGWGATALLAGAYAAACIPAVYAADVAGTGPGVWLPNGLLAGGLLTLRNRPAIALLLVCGVVLTLMHLWRASYYASHFIAMDIAVPVAVAALAHRFCGAALDLSRGWRLWRFVVLAAAPPVLASAALGAVLSQSDFDQPELTLAGVWLLTDLFGVVLGAVAVLTFARRRSTTPPGRHAEAALLLLLTAAATLCLFAMSLPLAIIFPLLLLITFRLGAGYSALSVAVFVGIAAPLFLVTRDAGVLSGAADPVTRVGQLHLFVGLILLCTFPTFTALADRTRDRARLARQSAAARAARRRAEASDLAKSRFLAVMSHELRTPLTGISGAGDLLAAREDLPAEARQQVENLRRACAVLAETIDDILDYSRSEAGKVDLVSERFTAADLLERTSAVLAGRAADKGLIFTIEAGRDARAPLLGDPRRLVQVLLNLAANAIRFTDAGRVVVRAEVQAAAGDDVVLMIEVQDTGVGFSPDALPTLFQPFTQADPGVWRTRGGSGLGLAICKSLLDQMGGSITATSRPGAGATFRVQAPVRRADGAAGVQTPPDAVRLSGRVLVVEDEPVWRDLASSTLRRAGLDVLPCGSGREAVDAARTGRFELILMDLGLPDLDGVQAAAAIRALGLAAGGPRIVALSAFTERSAADLAVAGFVEVLTKPIRLAALLDCAARYTSVQASAPAPAPESASGADALRPARRRP